MATTLFDQWVGRAPSALDLETRGTPRTHLSDRASAVPQVSTVLGGGESATYYDAERQARAFLQDNGVTTDHYGFPTDDAPHDDYSHPTAITAPRGDQPGVRRATGSATDATDDAAMDWPLVRYAVAHDERDKPSATAIAAPIYVYYTPLIVTPDGTVTRATDTAYRTLVRVDQQRVSKIGRVNHGRPRNYHKDKPASSTERAQATANPQITCVDCKRRTRKRHESITDKVCLPCGNERLTVETKTHILTDG